MKKIYLLLIAMLTAVSGIFAQSDCSSAIIVCGNTATYDPSGIGNKLEQLACGGIEHNSIWIAFQAKASGKLNFVIRPFTPAGIPALSDFDWSLYALSGPPNTGNCDNKTQLSCNFSGTATVFGIPGATGMATPPFAASQFNPAINVTNGNWYVLIVDQFSNTIPLGFTVQFTGNPESAALNSTPGIFDNRPDFTINNTSGCSGTFNFVNSSVAAAGIASYAWNFGDGSTGSGANPSHTYATTGTYYVTLEVTDNNGCKSYNRRMLAYNNTPPVVSTAGIFVTSACSNSNNGVITVNSIGTTTAGVSGGTPPYTYELVSPSPSPRPSQSSNTFTGLQPGGYTVKVTDACGKSATATVTVGQVATNTSIGLGIQNIQSACTGTPTGSATIFANGTVPPYTMALVQSSPVTITAQTAVMRDPITATYYVTFENLLPGSYTVEATDGCGKIRRATFTVTASTLPIANTVASPSCAGTPTGTLTVTATAATGLSGAGSPGTYQYSLIAPSAITRPFQSSSVFENLLPGAYTVAVRDACGNIGTATANVTSAIAPTFGTAFTTPSCPNGATGSIEAQIATAGGGTPYTFELVAPSPVTRPAQTSNLFSNLPPGAYTVRLTDACGSIVNSTVTVPAASAPTFTNTLTASCSATASGTATIVPGASSIGPFTFELISPGAAIRAPQGSNVANTTSSIFTALNQGSYTVRMTDGCGVPVTNTLSITGPTALVFPAGSTAIPSCAAGSTGQITVAQPTTGLGAYKYELIAPSPVTAGPQYSRVFNNLPVGSFTIRITDSCGSQVTIGTPLDVVAATAPTFSVSNTSSCASNTGTITALATTANQGGGAYLFALIAPSPVTTANQSSPLFTGLPAGNYTVRITDQCGNTGTTTTTIAAAGAFAPTAGGSIVSCNGSNYNGQIIVTNPQNYTPGGPIPPGSGGGPYTYALYNFDNTVLLAGPQSSNIFTIVVPSTGTPTHTVRVTDICGNTSTATATINNPLTLSAATISVTTASCAASPTGVIRITTTSNNGFAPYTYTLIDAITNAVVAGPQSSIVFNGVPANGTNGYLVRSVDACGNIATSSTPLLFPAAAAPGGSVVTVPSCVSSATGRITVIPNTGATQAGGTFTYALYDVTNVTLISGPQSSAVFNNVAPGDYTVRITDRCGTTGTVTANVANTPAALTAAGTVTGTCPGGNTGVITGSFTGGSLPVTYTLVNQPTNTVITGPQSDNIFAGIAAGTYIVRVTDACGTVANSANIVVADLTATPTITTSTAIDCSGSAIIGGYGAGGNGGPYTYAICNGAGCTTFGAFSTTSTFTVVTSGTYRIAVRDRCGNQTSSSDIVVNIPVKGNITGITKAVLCGPTTITVSFTNVPNTPYYSLDGANFAPSLGTIGLGAHTLRVTDYNAGTFGCASDVFNFFVGTNPTVTNPVVTTGTVGTPFSQTFTQSGGQTPVTFTTGSALPGGITLSPAGVLSGTPSAGGSFPIVVTATDINSCVGVGTTYTLNIVNTYCVPSTTNGCANGDSLAYFSLKGNSAAIYNPSGPACNGSPLAYSDYTGAFPALTITRGETYGGFMRTGNANDYATIWIDANDDAVFDNSERILSNLQIGTTKKLYAIYIPSTMPLGNHRLRVRVVNYPSAPVTPTDPCSLYANGETEDYLISITNAGTSRTVAPGIPGSCGPVSVTTIGTESNNASAIRVFILDSANNYIAGISPNGNELGTVTASVYVHNGAVRQDAGGRYYLDRNLTISTSIAPVSSYNMRYFYRNSELNALIAQPGSGVTSQFDLNMTKTATNTCNSVFATNSSVFVAPTGFGSLGGDRFLDFTALTGFSSFFLHGGSTVITSAGIVTTGSLTPFTACTGVTSAEQTFIVSATGLTANLDVTAPAGFEVSLTSGSGFGSGVSLPQVSGNVANTTIYVRMAAGAPGSPSGNIVCSSASVSSVNVPVSGTIDPNNTITLTSAAGTNAQTICINTPITNITYSTTGATGATFSGLPAGVTGNWAANVVTISGSPTTTVGSPFSYTVTLTGGCGTATATGTITVSPNNTITLTSAAGTNAQTVCINTPITNITYSTTGATGATFSGLPSGVTGNWAANVVTISGSPTTTVGSPFNYTVTLTGGCGVVTANGTITVNAIPATPTITPGGPTIFCAGGSVTLTSSSASSNQWYINGNPIGGANSQTYIATASGTYTVTVTLAGCPSAPSAGTVVTVNPIPATPTITPGGPTTFCAGGSVTLTSSSASGNQWYINSNPIGGANGQTYVATASGTYTVIITTSGCSSASSAGTIVTVNSNNTISLTSAAGTDGQSICQNTPITNITYSTTGATGATFSGLPPGVTGNWAANVVTISGTPTTTVGSPFSYTITLTGGCGTVTAGGTITVNPIPDASATPTSQSRCSGAGIQPIIISGSIPGTSFDWVRDNVGTIGGSISSNGSGNISGILVNNTGSPVTVTFTITPTANGCPGTPITATVTVNPLPLAVITSPGLSNCQNSNTILSAASSTGPGPLTYAWGTSLFTNPFTPVGTNVTQPIDVSSNILLTVTNQYGCVDTAMTTVLVADYIFNGNLAPGDASQTGRLNRFATISTCAAPKGCPGTFTTTGSRLYDAYTVTNPYNQPVCATIGITSFCATNIFCAAYLGAFNPASVCTNYLADPGSSFTTSGFYEATIPANATITIVVHEVNPNTGCAGYRVSVHLPRNGIIVSPAGPYCSSTPITLTAPPANNYVWTPGGATTQTIAVTPPVGTTTYSVQSGFGNWGCVGDTSVDLVVQQTPNVNTVADQYYCAGSTTPVITLNGTVSGATYNWTNTNTAIGLAASGSGDIPSFTATNATAAPVSATITVTPVLGLCTGTPMTFTITVANQPMITSVTNDSVCAPGGIVNLAATGTGIINWYDSLTGGHLVNTGTTYSPNITTTTTFFVESLVNTPAATTLTMPGQSNTFPGNIRGYWFTAPVDFVITALRVPTTASSGPQNIAVLRFNGNTPPPVFSASTNAFSTLFIARQNTSIGKIPVNIQVRAGEVIGILGSRGGINSYAPGDYVTSIFGQPVQLERMGMQFPLETTNPRDIWREFGATTSISRIEFDYASVSCNSSPRVAVTGVVKPVPVVTATPSSQTICSGSAITAIALTSSPAATAYAWTRDNTGTVTGIAASGTGNNISGTLTNTTNAPITVTFTITSDLNGCAGTPVTATVVVNPIPNAVATPSTQTSCSATPITTIALTGNVAGTVYNWTRDNIVSVTGIAVSGVGNISGTLTNTTNAPQTVIFTITPSYTNAGTTCTGASITATVIVNPTPTVNAVASQVVCNNSPTAAVNFSGSVPGTVYNWTNNNPFIGLAGSGSGDIASFTAINGTNAPEVATITVTPSYTNAGTTCTGTPITFTITVNPTVIINPVANQTLCNGATSTAINFTSPTTGGTIVYNWTNDQPSIGLAASGTGNIASFTAVNVTNAPVVATITVTPAYTNGSVTCNGTPITFTITVNPPPVVNPVPNQVVCNNSPTANINFTTPSSGGTAVFNWTNNNTSIGLAASGTGDILSFNATNATNAPVTATITVTMDYTNGGVTCVSLPVTFTITVNPTPQVNQPANQVLCAGVATAPITFTSPTTGGTLVFNWTNNTPSIGLAASGSGDIPGFIAVNTSNVPVIATIVVTPSYTNGAVTCTGPSKSFTITVNPTPTVAPVSNKAYCTGATTAVIPFNGTAGGTVAGTQYNWTNSNTAIGLAASGTGDIMPFVTTNATNGPLVATIVVTPVGPTGCVGTPITFTITVNPTPIVNPVTGQVLCNGSPTAVISFTSPTTGPTGALSFQWTNSAPSIGLAANGSGNIPSFIAVNTGLSPVIALVTVTPVYNNAGIICTGTSQTFTITVNPTPTVNAVASQVLCNGSSTAAVTFSGSVPGTIYNWTNNNTSIGLAASGAGNIASFVATNATNAPVVATITVTPNYTNTVTCPGTPITFTITVNPIPSVNPPLSQVACAGATVTQTFTGPVAGTVYNWTNTNTAIGLGASGTGNLNFTATNATNAPITGTITVTPTYTNAGGTCTGAPQSFTITVNPVPTVNAVSPQVVCNGAATAAVSFTGAVPGTVFNWTNTNTTIGLAAAGTGNIASFTATNAGTTPQVATITVTPSYTNGAVTCTGTPVTFTITVNPTPAVNTIANQTVCNGSATTAVTIAGPVAGTVYSWTNNNTSIGLGASGTNTIPSFTAFNAGSTSQVATITVTPTFTNGGISCTGPTSTFTITVNPTATVNQPANQLLCNGATTTAVTFSGLPPGSVYNWTNNNTAIGLAAAGTGNIASFTATNTTNAPITATITVTPTASGCGGGPVSFTITVNPTPSVNAIANQTLCDGANTAAVTLSGPVAGTVFTWSNSNPSIGLGPNGIGNIPSFTVNNPSNTVRVATITVTPSYTNGGVTCTGTPVSFTITVNPLPNIVFLNVPPRVCLTDTIVTLTATPGGTWSGPGVSGNTFSAAAAGIGVHRVTYTATNANGCTATRFANIVVNDCRERHNVFQTAIRIWPNPNQGRFSLQFNSDLYKEFKVKIVNARGQEVSSHEFKNLVYGQILPFDLSRLADGQYFLYVYNSKESGVFPIVIAR